MTFLRRLNNFIAKFEGWLLIFIVLFMVFLAFLQVVLRNLFAHGILWGDTFLRHLVLWIGFIGASLATKDEKHINIDALSRLLNERWKFGVQTIISLFSVVITSYLAWISWRFVMEEKEFGTILFNNIPVWYFQIIIPFGFALMSLRFLLSGMEKLIRTINYQEHV